MSGGSGPGGNGKSVVPSFQDVSGLGPLPSLNTPWSGAGQRVLPPELGERQARSIDANARASLRERISESSDIDQLLKNDLLLEIGNSSKSTSDIAGRFTEAVNPEGFIFKEYATKKERIKTLGETPGIDRQTMLTSGLAPQSNSLLTGKR